MIDRRQSLRIRAFKRGVIAYELALPECVVRNISAGGALLELDKPHLVPNDFHLIISPTNQKHRCQVIWRLARGIGVQFVK